MNTHISDQTLMLLKQGQLPIEEKIHTLSHIAECEECAARFSSLFSETIPAPPDLAQDIICKIQKIPDKSPSYFFYSLRVGLAACIAITILFSGLMTKINWNIQLPNQQKLTQLTGEMRNFTEKMIQWEVPKND